jgi:hypothetical protein
MSHRRCAINNHSLKSRKREGWRNVPLVCVKGGWVLFTCLFVFILFLLFSLLLFLFSPLPFSAWKQRETSCYDDNSRTQRLSHARKTKRTRQKREINEKATGLLKHTSNQQRYKHTCTHTCSRAPSPPVFPPLLLLPLRPLFSASQQALKAQRKRERDGRGKKERKRDRQICAAACCLANNRREEDSFTTTPHCIPFAFRRCRCCFRHSFPRFCSSRKKKEHHTTRK